jgi:hypothetical protein
MCLIQGAFVGEKKSDVIKMHGTNKITFFYVEKHVSSSGAIMSTAIRRPISNIHSSEP